tara:strand:+ start:46 stop:576 length:531 start_codon:yes stop_codon:yes gene_type:complete
MANVMNSIVPDNEDMQCDTNLNQSTEVVNDTSGDNMIVNALGAINIPPENPDRFISQQKQALERYRPSNSTMNESTSRSPQPPSPPSFTDHNQYWRASFATGSGYEDMSTSRHGLLRKIMRGGKSNGEYWWTHQHQCSGCEKMLRLRCVWYAVTECKHVFCARCVTRGANRCPLCN